jgi:cyanophycinase-like exopeptidase
MLTFVARLKQDFVSESTVVRAVGVDEHTALLLDVTTGEVSTVGVGTAYVCTPRHAAEICQAKTPETFTGNVT